MKQKSNNIVSSLISIATLTEDSHIEGDILVAIQYIEELEDALLFYAQGFAPHKENPTLPGFAYKPTEALLNDCGNLAIDTLNGKPR